jgi:hypothetical protein
MEATLFSGWIYDTLQPFAAELQTGHPAMMKAIGASKKKNDQRDARKISDLVRCLCWLSLKWRAGAPRWRVYRRFGGPVRQGSRVPGRRGLRQAGDLRGAGAAWREVRHPHPDQ